MCSVTIVVKSVKSCATSGEQSKSSVKKRKTVSRVMDGKNAVKSILYRFLRFLPTCNLALSAYGRLLVVLAEGNIKGPLSLKRLKMVEVLTRKVLIYKDFLTLSERSGTYHPAKVHTKMYVSRYVLAKKKRCKKQRIYQISTKKEKIRRNLYNSYGFWV